MSFGLLLEVTGLSWDHMEIILGVTGNDSKHAEGNWDILGVSVTLLQVMGTPLGATGTMLGTAGTMLEATESKWQ